MDNHETMLDQNGGAINELRAAVEALYGGSASSRESANAYLIDAVTKPEVWTTSLQILESKTDEPKFKFFAANLLLTKAKREKLVASARDELAGRLLAVLDYEESKEVCERVCVLLTHLGIEAALEGQENALVILTQRGILYLQERGKPKLLRALAAEVAVCEASSSTRQGLQRVLSEAANNAHLYQMLIAFALKSIEGIEALRPWLELDPQQHILLEPLLSATIHALNTRQWLYARYAITALSEVYTNGLCLSHAQSAPAEPWLALARHGVTALVESQKLSTAKEYSAEEADCADTALALANYAVVLANPGSMHCTYISGPTSDLSLWNLASQCLSHPRRSIAKTVLDAWLELFDISIDERHQGLTQVVHQVLESCIYQSSLGLRDSKDEDEDDAVLSFRDAAVDIFISTYYAMGGLVFSQKLCEACLAALAVQNVDAAEAALFALSSAARDMTEELEESEEVRTQIARAAHAILSRPFISKQLTCTVLRLMALAPSLFRRNDSFASVTLKYASRALEDTEMRSVAANAVRTLCLSSPHFLFFNHSDLLFSMHATVAQGVYGSSADREARSSLVTALARLCAHVEDEENTAMAARIALEPSTAALGAALNDRDPRRAVLALRLLEAAIAYCREKQRLLHSFLQHSWPLVEACHTHFIGHPDAFRVIIRALRVHLALLESSTDDAAARLLIEASLNYYEQHGLTAALPCLAQAVESLAASSQDFSVSIAERLIRVSIPRFGISPPTVHEHSDFEDEDDESCPDHDAAVLEALKKMALYTSSPLPAAAWDIGINAISHQSASPAALRAAANLFTALSRRSPPNPFETGAKATSAVLGVLRAGGPSTARPALAEALHTLVAHDQGARWIMNLAETSQETNGNSSWNSILENLIALIPQKQKFKALAVDIAKLYAGELSFDAIMSAVEPRRRRQ